MQAQQILNKSSNKAVTIVTDFALNILGENILQLLLKLIIEQYESKLNMIVQIL